MMSSKMPHLWSARARAQKVYCTRAQARAIALKTAQKSRVDLARPDVA